MKKSFYIFSFVFLFSIFTLNFAFLGLFGGSMMAYADTESPQTEIYYVYYENEVIFEGNRVYVGDKIIDKDLNEYEIYKVDDDNQIAYAELNGHYEKPKVNKKSKNLNLSNKIPNKSVGLYMSHNDESYVPTDNTSSVYGKGGIHDVARSLQQEFEKLNYSVYLDETLHLPHDSGAYTRSKPTAQNLLKNSPDALFDIHRDGVDRSVYVKKIDGVDRCKVRIVVGQANPNKEANLQFAMYLVSVAKEYCPWLFLDIYMAKGHYNQALTNKGLLFEMGTYLAEKELVLNSVPYLASVVDKTLFSTVVEEDNNLVITDTPTIEQQENLVSKVLDNYTPTPTFSSKYISNVLIFASIFVFAMGTILTIVIIKHKRKLKNKK